MPEQPDYVEHAFNAIGVIWVRHLFGSTRGRATVYVILGLLVSIRLCLSATDVCQEALEAKAERKFVPKLPTPQNH